MLQIEAKSRTIQLKGFEYGFTDMSEIENGKTTATYTIVELGPLGRRPSPVSSVTGWAILLLLAGAILTGFVAWIIRRRKRPA